MASGSKTGALTSSFGVTITWSTSPNVVGNYSSVTVNLYLNYYSVAIGARTASIWINGSQYDFDIGAITDYSSGLKNRYIASKTVNIAHNSDGSRGGVGVSGLFNYNLTNSSTGAWVGSRSAETTATFDSIDRAAPTVYCSVSNVTASSLSITASSNCSCDIWDYSLNGGSSWTNFYNGSTTSTSKAVTGLTPNTAYTVKVRARRAYNQVYGSSGNVSKTTLGNTLLNSVNTLTVDVASPVLTMNWTVYAGYTHTLVIKDGSTTVLTLTGLTCSTGTNNKTISLTSAQRSTILNHMASLASFTATYYLTTYSGSTQIGSTVSKTAIVQTTSTTSKPTFTGFTHSDTNGTTVAVTEDNSKYVKSKSALTVIATTATAKNGASIVSYKATVGSKTVSSNTTTISFGTISTYGNVTLTVTATDSRGYTTSVSAIITVVDYTDINITDYAYRRVNEVESTVQLSFSGQLSSITIGGTAKNALRLTRIYYKKTTDASYNYCVKTPESTSYSFTFATNALSNSDGVIVFDPELTYDIRIFVWDKLSSDYVDLVLNKGTPLVAFRAKKVGINKSDPQCALDVAGEIMQNGTYVLGYVGSVEADFNNYKTGGIFIYSGMGASNAPTSAGLLEVISNGNGMVIQRFTAFSAGCALYVRSFYNNTTWTAWTSK